MIKVMAGQLWRDNDPHMKGLRIVKVLEVTPTYVYARRERAIGAGRRCMPRTRISLGAFHLDDKPRRTGFSL